jgi:hypothetical protein
VIVLGIDPGSRTTGLAVVDHELGKPSPVLWSGTITNPGDLLDMPEDYLRDVVASALYAVRQYDAERIGVELVKRPSWRVGGKVKPLDPVPIMGTAIVLGAILGRAWTVPIERVQPRGNGHLLPLTRYPDPLATTGKGGDKRRHERSAYDVAVLAAANRGRPPR